MNETLRGLIDPGKLHSEWNHDQKPLSRLMPEAELWIKVLHFAVMDLKRFTREGSYQGDEPGEGPEEYRWRVESLVEFFFGEAREWEEPTGARRVEKQGRKFLLTPPEGSCLEWICDMLGIVEVEMLREFAEPRLIKIISEGIAKQTLPKGAEWLERIERKMAKARAAA